MTIFWQCKYNQNNRYPKIQFGIVNSVKDVTWRYLTLVILTGDLMLLPTKAQEIDVKDFFALETQDLYLAGNTGINWGNFSYGGEVGFLAAIAEGYLVMTPYVRYDYTPNSNFSSIHQIGIGIRLPYIGLGLYYSRQNSQISWGPRIELGFDLGFFHIIYGFYLPSQNELLLNFGKRNSFDIGIGLNLTRPFKSDQAY